jgi:hypothetical protein
MDLMPVETDEKSSVFGNTNVMDAEVETIVTLLPTVV